MLLHENNCNYNSHRFSYKFVFFFVLSDKPKTRIRFFASWWSGSKKYFCFLFIAIRVLLKIYADFNRLLQRNFLTCYCSWYYSSILYVCYFVVYVKNRLFRCYAYLYKHVFKILTEV